MNHEVAILYAKQRMRELCKSVREYHFEPIEVCPTEEQDTNGFFIVNAYNEIYILVNPEKHSGLLILSDNSAFNSGNAIDNGVPEFTGQIRFIKTGLTWSLGKVKEVQGFVEFIRVVIY